MSNSDLNVLNRVGESVGFPGGAEGAPQCGRIVKSNPPTTSWGRRRRPGSVGSSAPVFQWGRRRRPGIKKY